jgi:subtilisin family serine protease
VLDTGIWPEHDEFKTASGASRIVEALSFLSVSTDPGYENGTDVDGHGTHVAGLAAGLKYGVASSAHIHSFKVLDDTGSGRFSDIVAALNYVLVNGSRPAVVSISIEGDGFDLPTSQTIQLLRVSMRKRHLFTFF